MSINKFYLWLRRFVITWFARLLRLSSVCYTCALLFWIHAFAGVLFGAPYMGCIRKLIDYYYLFDLRCDLFVVSFTCCLLSDNGLVGIIFLYLDLLVGVMFVSVVIVYGICDYVLRNFNAIVFGWIRVLVCVDFALTLHNRLLLLLFFRYSGVYLVVSVVSFNALITTLLLAGVMAQCRFLVLYCCLLSDLRCIMIIVADRWHILVTLHATVLMMFQPLVLGQGMFQASVNFTCGACFGGFLVSMGRVYVLLFQLTDSFRLNAVFTIWCVVPDICLRLGVSVFMTARLFYDELFTLHNKCAVKHQLGCMRDVCYFYDWWFVCCDGLVVCRQVPVRTFRVVQIASDCCRRLAFGDLVWVGLTAGMFDCCGVYGLPAIFGHCLWFILRCFGLVSAVSLHRCHLRAGGVVNSGGASLVVCYLGMPRHYILVALSCNNFIARYSLGAVVPCYTWSIHELHLLFALFPFAYLLLWPAVDLVLTYFVCVFILFHFSGPADCLWVACGFCAVCSHLGTLVVGVLVFGLPIIWMISFWHVFSGCIMGYGLPAMQWVSDARIGFECVICVTHNLEFPNFGLTFYTFIFTCRAWCFRVWDLASWCGLYLWCLPGTVFGCAGDLWQYEIAGWLYTGLGFGGFFANIYCSLKIWCFLISCFDGSCFRILVMSLFCKGILGDNAICDFGDFGREPCDCGGLMLVWVVWVIWSSCDCGLISLIFGLDGLSGPPWVLLVVVCDGLVGRGRLCSGHAAVELAFGFRVLGATLVVNACGFNATSAMRFVHGPGVVSVSKFSNLELIAAVIFVYARLNDCKLLMLVVVLRKFERGIVSHDFCIYNILGTCHEGLVVVVHDAYCLVYIDVGYESLGFTWIRDADVREVGDILMACVLEVVDVYGCWNWFVS
eukprot:gene3244-2226_t